MSSVKAVVPNKKYIYMDYAASTPLDPQVLKSFYEVSKTFYGNTMSLHQKGMEAKELLESIRENFAKILKVSPVELIFTASATESNNFALKGIAMANMKNGNHIITSSQEHSSINSICQ